VTAGELRSATVLPDAGDSDRFDFIENAESTGSRSQSTISDVACWDTPFAHDSLGDTVIHFDRASEHPSDNSCILKFLLHCLHNFQKLSYFGVVQTL